MKRLEKSRRGLRRVEVLSWLRLARVFEKTERAGDEQLRDFGLNMGQFDVLAHVGASEGLSQGELAASLLVSKGNVAQLMRKMERTGVIHRVTEGRTKRVYLTESGRELYDEVVPAHEDFIASRFDALTNDENRTLHALLSKLDRGTDRR